MVNEPLTKDKLVTGEQIEAAILNYVHRIKMRWEGEDNEKLIKLRKSKWIAEEDHLSVVRLLREKVKKFKNNAEKEKFTKPFAIGQRDGQIGAANQFLQYIDEVLGEVGK